MYFELLHLTSFFLRATVQASVDGFRAIALPAARSNTAGVAVTTTTHVTNVATVVGPFCPLSPMAISPDF